MKPLVGKVGRCALPFGTGKGRALWISWKPDIPSTLTTTSQCWLSSSFQSQAREEDKLFFAKQEKYCCTRQAVLSLSLRCRVLQLKLQWSAGSVSLERPSTTPREMCKEIWLEEETGQEGNLKVYMHISQHKEKEDLEHEVQVLKL